MSTLDHQTNVLGFALVGPIYVMSPLFIQILMGYVGLIGPTLEVREVSTPPRSQGIFVGGKDRMNVRKLDHILCCHSHIAHDQILPLFTVFGYIASLY